jgi:iron(III) transport system substrate-binding protein
MKRSSWSLLLVAAALVAACAPARPSAPAAPPAASAARSAEEAEWDRVLQAARQEGTVVVAGYPTDEARQASTEPFEKRYGITVQFEPLGGPQGAVLAERVRTERAAGQHRWDVFVGGTTTIINALKPMGAVEPIEAALLLPEVKDPGRWRRGLEFTDAGRGGVVMMPYSVEAFMINPRLARPEEFQSYRDLLAPRWKGQIVAHDPRIAGSGQAVFSFYYAHRDLGPEFLRALARQEPVILRDVRQELDMLAQGKATFCTGCSQAVAATMIERGLPIQVVNARQLREGGYITSGGGNVALFNNAPHPNAAKVYLNWLLGPEGQTGLARALAYPSARLDVANDWVEPWQLPADGFWPSHTEESVLGAHKEVVPFVKELFGE